MSSNTNTRKADIGWEHATAFEGDKRKPKCNYCSKVLNGGITRLKEHLAHHSGNVAGCPQVSKELMLLMQRNIAAGKSEKEIGRRKKDEVMQSLKDDVAYGYGETNYHEMLSDGTDPLFYGMTQNEIRDIKIAIIESRAQTDVDDYNRRHSISYGGGEVSTGSQFHGSRVPTRSQSQRVPFDRRSTEDEIRRADPYAFSTLASKQKKIKNFNVKESFLRVGRSISNFILYNAIPFSAADNGPFYKVMIETIAEFGKGITGPSGRQLAGEFLQYEVDDLTKYILDLRKKWPEYGCTIMCDGWSLRNKHPIVNFMVHCNGDMIFHKSFDTTGKKKTTDFIYGLMKDVVKEVGEKNVVHIVTDNEASYKAAGKKLMNKYKHLFWSPCAAHCIDLILEDIGNMSTVKGVIQSARKITSFIYNSDQLVNCMRVYTGGRELLRPGITRFATEYIAIESLLIHKQELRRLCTSEEWSQLSYVKNKAKSNLAKEVCDLVLRDSFWKKAADVQIAMEPLVLVLKLVDQEKKPTMSVIYDAMDRAKNGIKMANVKDWKQYWSIIDSRWERQLHCSLHAAGYFLNPMCQYGENFVYDEEVRLGLKEVIRRLERNVETQARALTEAQIFRDREGSFGTTLAQTSVKFQLPAEWWFHHGEDAPNLRKVAIKVLSQTCSSSGCERNWSTFALIHTQIRNRLAMKKLEQLVFVHYNLRLRVRKLSKKHSDDNEYCPIDLNNMFNDQDSLDPWITEVEEPVLDDQDMSWLDTGLRVYATDEGVRQQSSTANVTSSTSSPSGEGGNRDDDEDRSGDQRSSDRADNVNDGYDNQETGRETSHTWQEGEVNYYATQDTDHGYRPADPAPGINERRRHLRRLRDIPSQTPSDYHANNRSGQYEIPQQFNYHYQPSDGWPRQRQLETIGNDGNYRRSRSSRATTSQDVGSSSNYPSFGISLSGTPSTPSGGMEISSCEGESLNSNTPMSTLFPFPYDHYAYLAQEEPIEPHRHSVWWG